MEVLNLDFKSERAALNLISETIVKCGISLYNAIKYIYSLAEEDFYNCSIKDALKVTLNNLTDCDSLQALGLRINNNKCAEMNSPEYNKVLSLMVFSFAVRVPLLKLIKNGNDTMTEEQIHTVYQNIIAKGASNYNEIIKESYLETKHLIKKGKPVPAYSSDWYKTYIYTNVPALSEITNKNMFLLGFVDILFAMFYSCMEEEIRNLVLSQCVNREDS